MTGAATAAATALQVLLPRVFSVLLWYHLGFFAVSLAMLGFATGGILVLRRVLASGVAGGGVDTARCLAFCAGAIVLSLIVVVRLPLDPSSLLVGIGAPLMLFASAALLAAPLVLLGMVVCASLDRQRERVAVVYGGGFLGGALGAMLALGAMEWLGAPAALGVIAIVLAVIAGGSGAAHATASASLILGLAVAIVPDTMLPLDSRKHFPVITPEQQLHQEWNSISRVTFYENPMRDGLWEMPRDYTGPLPESIGVAIDAWAITSILKVGDGPSRRFLSSYPPTLLFEGAPKGFTALVVGAGGGVDVLGALHAGASHVTAVEINPTIVDAVRERYREFSGDLYRDPRVRAVVSEGRRFVEDDDQHYDRVVLSGVDTFASTEAGAFALSENYLYTVEALEAWYEHLTEGGVLGMTRWWFDPPRQTLRLVLTAREAMTRLGVTEMRDRVFLAVTSTGTNSLFLLKRGAFSTQEVDRLIAEAHERGCTIVYAPGRPSSPLYERALDLASAAEVAEESAYRVDPTTDDRPYFFENSRLVNAFGSEGDWIHDRAGGVELLLATLVGLLILSLPMAVLGLRGRSRGDSPVAPRRIALPFALLGMAFMLVEISLLPRLTLILGHPVYAVSVVLVALLIGSGIGSIVASRTPAARAPGACAAAGILVMAVLVFAYPELLDASASIETPGRVALVTMFLALPAFVMGMPFPLGIRFLAPYGPTVIPTAFVFNGLASVLAGPIAVILSMEIGFRGTLQVGAACYILAALALAWSRPAVAER